MRPVYGARIQETNASEVEDNTMATSMISLPLTREAPLGEVLLAETAVRVELPPSWHKRAVDRYEAVRQYIERPDSPLHGLVELFYPQGSMAIRATIRARKRDSGYDIDLVAELRLPYETTPERALDVLHRAIKGEPGSRYHDKVERQTRCVTVHYEDGMHLDVTPSILLDPEDPRRSWIFHAKPGESAEQHTRLTINSYGFAEWFNERTPIDLEFAESYRRRVLAMEQGITLAEAEAEPVPDHWTEDGGKSATIVALQLLKRNRNIRYVNRHVRMPPSVLLSCEAGRVAAPHSNISSALDAISRALLKELEAADRAGRLVDVRNPRCEVDRFTDRWPENLAAQRQYIADLREFRTQLTQLMAEGSLEDKSELLKKMFGEEPARSVIDDYWRELDSAVSQGTRSIDRSGRIITGAGASSAAASANANRPRSHRFYGETW